MILVRQVFQTQAGRSQELAAMVMQGVAQFRRTAGPDVHSHTLCPVSANHRQPAICCPFGNACQVRPSWTS